jgi:hypothetical protein
MSELVDRATTDIAAGVTSRRFSAVDVADTFLVRIVRYDSAVKAICTRDPEARDTAAGVDRRLASGRADPGRSNRGSRNLSPTGDRGFESISLQRRVRCEPHLYGQEWRSANSA